MGDDEFYLPCLISFIVALIAITVPTWHFANAELPSVANMSGALAVLVFAFLIFIAFLIGAVFVIDSKAQKVISKLNLGDKISFNGFGEGTNIGPSKIKPFIKVQFPDGEIRHIDVFGRSALANCVEDGEK